MNRSCIITIDGPAGTGKSTIARVLAKRLELDFLDTGAMYRVIAMLTIEAGIHLPFDTASKRDKIVELAREADIAFEWQMDPPRIYIRSSVVPVAEGSVERVEINQRIRTPEISARVSHVAAIPDVRKLMVAAQQRIGQARPGLVTEGRDQGSVVFPDALVKFYLDASAKERARRRVLQLESSGMQVDATVILENIIERDRIDSTREEGPLIKPSGAILIDTTDLTIDQVLDQMESHVRQRMTATDAMETAT